MALVVARRTPQPPPPPQTRLPVQYGETRFLTRLGDLIAQDPAPTTIAVLSFIDAEFRQLNALSDFQSVTINFLTLTLRRRRCTFKVAAYRFLKARRVREEQGGDNGLAIRIVLRVFHATKWLWYYAFDVFVDHGLKKEYKGGRKFAKGFFYWCWWIIRINSLFWKPLPYLQLVR
jgi:hypothetical protein